MNQQRTTDRTPAASQPEATRLDRRIRQAEAALFARYGVAVEESFARLGSGPRLRVLSAGAGPALVLLPGSALAAPVWAPWLGALGGYRAHLVDLPGHGLSDPVMYRPGQVREAALTLIDDLLAALGLETAAVIGHSVGGMYALWHAAARPGKISCLILAGAPAGALPGLRIRIPTSLLTVPVLGQAMLRMPSPRQAYRTLLTRAMGSMPAATDELIDVLRLSARRPGSAASVTSLHRAVDLFHEPRPETTLTDSELGQVTVPVMFCWGRDDPFMSPRTARPSIAKIPRAVLHEIPGGHVPWLDDPVDCARLVTGHLRAAGLFPS